MSVFIWSLCHRGSPPSSFPVVFVQRLQFYFLWRGKLLFSAREGNGWGQLPPLLVKWRQEGPWKGGGSQPCRQALKRSLASAPESFHATSCRALWGVLLTKSDCVLASSTTGLGFGFFRIGYIVAAVYPFFTSQKCVAFPYQVHTPPPRFVSFLKKSYIGILVVFPKSLREICVQCIIL